MKSNAVLIAMNIYKNVWSCATPGLLIILLDQSDSMLKPSYDRGSRSEVSAYMINRAIDNIIQKNFDGDWAKNHCFISIIGYNHNVKEICSGWLRDIEANPLRIENLKKKFPDGAGGLIEVVGQQPVWVDPVEVGGDANMLGAFSYAKELVQKWISDNPQYPIPVIISISDGVPYYDGKDSLECMKETTDLAKEIMSMSNEDGNVLVYNVQVGSILKNTEIFPNNRNKLKQEETKFLFDISSEVPESHLGYAGALGHTDKEIWQQLLWQGSRGLTNTIWDLLPLFPDPGDSAYREIFKIPEPTNDNMAESIKTKWRKGNGYETQTTVDMADIIRAKWRK